MVGLSLKITDNTHSKTWELLEVPFKEQTNHEESRLTTRSGKICVYHKYSRRIWQHRWSYMTRVEYEELRGFVDRQRQANEFPKISIRGLGIDELPAMLELNERKIIYYDGLVSGVSLVMTEVDPK